MLKGAAFFMGLGVLAANLVHYFVTKEKTPSEQEPIRTKRISLGGEWKLTGAGNKVVSSQDLKGQYYLIYFGFTKCPEICPTTLRYATATYRLFQTLSSSPLKIVFVSVDPKRDTPD